MSNYLFWKLFETGGHWAWKHYSKLVNDSGYLPLNTTVKRTGRGLDTVQFVLLTILFLNNAKRGL